MSALTVVRLWDHAKREHVRVKVSVRIDKAKIAKAIATRVLANKSSRATALESLGQRLGVLVASQSKNHVRFWRHIRYGPDARL